MNPNEPAWSSSCISLEWSMHSYHSFLYLVIVDRSLIMSWKCLMSWPPQSFVSNWKHLVPLYLVVITPCKMVFPPLHFGHTPLLGGGECTFTIWANSLSGEILVYVPRCSRTFEVCWCTPYLCVGLIRVFVQYDQL